MDGIEQFTRHFLAVYFLMIGLYYSSRSYALSERMGFTHIHYGRRWGATWWYRHLFNLFRAGILLVCVLRVPFDVDQWLGVIGWLYHPLVLAVGVLLLLLAYVVIIYVQAYMHQDWRSGIDPDGGRTLVTTGPFARSRNPLFLGILTGQLGFFLALPSLFALICLLVGATVIVLQARAEEKALRREFGEPYEAYCRQVARWL
ncbi:isoprenylcysteine carboxylmethyltransferase family protein [Marinobacteraceae bacterium S3BR75-40.1]